MVAMCVHEVAAAATADAMSVIYEVTELDPASMLAVRLVNTLYMETLMALKELDEECRESGYVQEDTGYNPEDN